MEKTQEIIINGQRHPHPDPLSLMDILQKLKIDSRFVAVAVNGEVVPRSELEPYIVRAGDTVEVIRAVAGG